MQTFMLADDLSGADKNIEEAGVRCRGIRCALEAKLDQCREAERLFEHRFKEITELVTSLDVDAGTFESMQKLLDRLKPWENLLLRDRGEHEGLPESLAKTVEELQKGVGQDLLRISGMMNDIARRINQSGITGRPPAAMTEVKFSSVANGATSKAVAGTVSDTAMVNETGEVTIETKSKQSRQQKLTKGQ